MTFHISRNIFDSKNLYQINAERIDFLRALGDY